MSQIELRNERRQRSKLSRKYRRDSRLHELERQLEFAESRCGTLKQQLDYVKMLYGRKKSFPCSREDFSRNESHGDGADVVDWNIQNSALGGGEFRNTTKPTKSFTNATRTSNSSRKQESSKTGIKKSACAEDRKEKSSKSIKRKKIPKIKPVKKFTRNQRHRIRQDPVVTIYKNSDVDSESESRGEIEQNQKIKMATKNSQKFGSSRKDESDPDLEETKIITVKVSKSTSVKENKEESVQTESSFDPAVQIERNNGTCLKSKDTLKPEDFSDVPKNYSQPTISSKRKQIDRNVFGSLNVKNIPFIAATSTTPSHNIGVNIQQILSIAKKRRSLERRESSLFDLLNGNRKKNGEESNAGIEFSNDAGDEKRTESLKSNLSYWKRNVDVRKERNGFNDKLDEPDQDWNFRVGELKKVLVFLHEDFVYLSQKYKSLRKKLAKRNFNKTEAKGELGEIERDLEKKEEEIIVIIGLYKEILNLRDELKRAQEKFDLIPYGKNFTVDNLKQTNSTHTQTMQLLRKIQYFQEKLKE